MLWEQAGPTGEKYTDFSRPLSDLELEVYAFILLLVYKIPNEFEKRPHLFYQ